MNVCGQHGGKNQAKVLSGMAALGFQKATLGVGTGVGNDMGVRQVAVVAPQAAQGKNVGTKFGKLVRGILTLDVGGFDTLVGFGIVTGKAGKPVAITKGPGEFNMNMQFIDVQMQGDLGDMSVGVYADWSHAKGKSDTATGLIGNYYGIGTTTVGSKSDAFSIRADLEPIAGLIVGGGYGYAKNTTGAAAAQTKSQFQIGATYEIYQNLEVRIVYNSTKSDIGNAVGVAAVTTKTTTLEFEGVM